MNKVVTINLGGNAYQLEEGGYDALQAYLGTAVARLAGNPDQDEILSDIERAIEEKFQALLSSNKTVVEMKEVAAVPDAMGPIETEPGEASESGESGHGGSGKQWEQGEESGGIRVPLDGAEIHPPRQRRILRGHERLSRQQGAL